MIALRMLAHCYHFSIYVLAKKSSQESNHLRVYLPRTLLDLRTG
jgi:hypothetical protein